MMGRTLSSIAMSIIIAMMIFTGAGLFVQEMAMPYGIDAYNMSALGNMGNLTSNLDQATGNLTQAGTSGAFFGIIPAVIQIIKNMLSLGGIAQSEFTMTQTALVQAGFPIPSWAIAGIGIMISLVFFLAVLNAMNRTDKV
jgi:hypothetical protein